MKCPKCGSKIGVAHTLDPTPTMTRRVRSCLNPICDFSRVTYEDLEEASAPLDRCLERIKAMARGISGKTIADRLVALADEIRRAC